MDECPKFDIVKLPSIFDAGQIRTYKILSIGYLKFKTKSLQTTKKNRGPIYYVANSWVVNRSMKKQYLTQNIVIFYIYALFIHIICIYMY